MTDVSLEAEALTVDVRPLIAMDLPRDSFE
jgi:hypothetical protein